MLQKILFDSVQKNHVTMKTEVIINYILKCIKIEKKLF